MASEELLHSFALFDADGRLLDWDDGFAQEWRYAEPALKVGSSYGALLKAALLQPGGRQFARENFQSDDVDTLLSNRLANFGVDRLRQYRTPNGRTIEVDERRTASGGLRRLARDITAQKHTGEALAEARQRLDAVDPDSYGVLTETRRTPDGIYHFGRISEGLCRMLHLPAELAGQDPMLIYSRFDRRAEDNAKSAAQMEHSARTLESFSLEYRIRDGLDRMRWVRESMMPRREPDGTVVFAGVMRDVTREKEAEDQLEMLRSVVVRSSDSIAIFESTPGDDRRSRIIYVNDRFTELFGWSADELIGQPIEYLEPNRLDQAAAQMMTAALLRDDGEPIETQSRGKDGRIFWIEARIAIIQRFDNGNFRWVVISHDISERRQVQQELLRAKDEAEAGNRAKSNFLANMSHELRTPLNAIIGFTELIEQGVDRTGWNESYREYLGDVSESGRHLLALINTILDLSKIEAGSLQINLAPVDVRELVETSISLVSSLARNAGVTVVTDLPSDCPEISGDFLKLKQVLLNVFSNAIKFTPAGGRITTKATFAPERVVISVSDTGCGISAADLQRVILPFVQVETALSRKFPGSGLGLAIARELCKLHGGQLTIDSVEGQGTTVHISLPRQPESETVQAPGNPRRIRS
jgi:PAS domain S-box-containing protein